MTGPCRFFAIVREIGGVVLLPLALSTLAGYLSLFVLIHAGEAPAVVLRIICHMRVYG